MADRGVVLPPITNTMTEYGHNYSWVLPSFGFTAQFSQDVVQPTTAQIWPRGR